MEACRHFKGDRPCKYYWIDRSWDCTTCSHHHPFKERILLIKLDELGDVMRATALAEGIKKKYPDAQFTWLVRDNALPFVKGNPYIDRIKIYNEDTIRSLLCEQFDILINLDKDPKAASLATIVPAKNKRGYGWHLEGYVIPFNKGAENHYTICLDNYGAKTTNKKSYQQLIFEIAELPYTGERPQLYLDPQKAALYREHFFQKNTITSHNNVIIFNTGCGPVYPHKKWTYEGFRDVGKRLLQDTNVWIILTGADSEVELNRDLFHDLNHPHVIDMTNQCSIEQFCYLINSANIVLTGDTVGLHIAIALHKKIISFFGPTPHQEIDLFGLGKKFVREELDCLNCYDQFPCPYGGRCMTLITPEEVYNTVQELR